MTGTPSQVSHRPPRAEPGYLPGEVEIARLRYTRTVHQEVTAVRARLDGDDICYRVVDEYLTEYECDPDCSEAPLTLGELIDLVDGVAYGEPRDRGLYFGDLWYRIRDEEITVGELDGWWEVESDFYPDLSRCYDAAVAVWAAAVRESGGTRRPSLSSRALVAGRAW